MHFQQVEIAGLVDEVEKVHQLKMKLNVDLKVVRPQGEFWTSTDRNRVMQVLFNFYPMPLRILKREVSHWD